MKTRNGDDIMGKIHLEGADNARDLGGLKTTEGAVIREKINPQQSFIETYAK